MIIRPGLITLCLVLASCGGETAAVKTAERLEQVENDCGVLTAQAAFNPGDATATNYCYCMVQLLEERPDIHVDAISRTFTVVTDEHMKSGDPFTAIAAKLHAEADSPDASDRSKALGIGISLVEDLSNQADKRAAGGAC